MTNAWPTFSTSNCKTTRVANHNSNLFIRPRRVSVGEQASNKMSRPYIPAIYDRPPSPLPLLPALPNLNLPPPAPKRKKKRQHPQKDVDQFWKLFVTKFPGNVTTILPNNPYARSKASKAPVGVVQAQKAIKSYDEARNECQRDVARIVKECRRVNHKYRDPHFDIELDLKLGANNCLYGLEDGGVLKPKGVKRVTVGTRSSHWYT